MKNLLANRTAFLSNGQLKGYVKDLIGDAGYNATAKDLAKLLNVTGGHLIGYRTWVITDHAEIAEVALHSVLSDITLVVTKKNGFVYYSKKCTTLINTVLQEETESYPHKCAKSDNLKSLSSALNKAENARGSNASLKEVLDFLHPSLRVRSGIVQHNLPGYDVTFTTLMGRTIIKIVDSNGFTKALTKGKQLRPILRASRELVTG